MKVIAENPAIRLRILMLANGFEAVDLVKHIGISISSIEKMMCGQFKPGPKMRQKLESFFDARIFSTPAQWRARRRAAK